MANLGLPSHDCTKEGELNMGFVISDFGTATTYLVFVLDDSFELFPWISPTTCNDHFIADL